MHQAETLDIMKRVTDPVTSSVYREAGERVADFAGISRFARQTTTPLSGKQVASHASAAALAAAGVKE
jgi:hypothetical protein